MSDDAEAKVETSSDNFDNVGKTKLSMVIIGAGISGLSIIKLCQVFDINVNIKICERDESLSSRSQGYSLTIQSNGIKVLNTMQLTQKIINHGVKQTKGSCYIHGKTGNNLTHLKGSGNSKNVYIPRETLRDLIYKSIDQKSKTGNIEFQYDRNFSHYQYDEKLRQFTVYFDNANPMKCDILLACDGLKSKARNCFLSQKDECKIDENIKNLNYLNVGMINGITSMNKDIISIFKQSMTDKNLGGSIQLLHDCKRIFAKPFDKDKIMWQLTFPLKLENSKQIYAINGAENSKQEMIKKRALLEMKDWNDTFKQMINDTPIGMLRAGVLYDLSTDLCMKIDTLRKDKLILFIGDSIHPMSPFRGQGANSAMEDTLEFGKRLCNAMKQAPNKINDEKQRELILNEISNNFKTFHESMGERTKQYVIGSRNNVIKLHNDNSIQFILDKYS